PAPQGKVHDERGDRRGDRHGPQGKEGLARAHLEASVRAFALARGPDGGAQLGAARARVAVALLVARDEGLLRGGRPGARGEGPLHPAVFERMEAWDSAGTPPSPRGLRANGS